MDAVAAGGRPADQALRHYLRGRRYVGGKDRRAIADTLYAILRRIVAIDHRLGDAPKSARLRVAAWLGDEAAVLFSGAGYGPAPLSAEEQAALARPAGALPVWAAVNLPEWLAPMFERRFGPDWAAEAEALNAEAPVDLRVNRLKATRDQAIAALAADGIAAAATPYAPDGLRVAGRFVLGDSKAHGDGWVEPQDEASQLAAHCVGAEPGMTVVDLCAGAGGKTLALGAAMANRGRLIACDRDADRLARLQPRAARAGLTICDQIVVNSAESIPDSLCGIADRVLVDSPCSGTGTWRRQPDGRLRLTPESVAEVTAIQSRLIANALTLLKPDGVLVYAVCSVLEEEGPRQVAEIQGFRPVPPDRLAAAHELRTLPAPCFATGNGLSFSPRTTGTDGFFLAALAR